MTFHDDLQRDENNSTSRQTRATRSISSLALSILLLIASGLLFIQDDASLPTVGLLVLGAVSALVGFVTSSSKPRLATWMAILAAAFCWAGVVWGPRSAEALFHQGLLPRIHFMGLDAMAVPLMGALAAFSVALFLGAPALRSARGRAAQILASVGWSLFAIVWILPQPTTSFSPIDSHLAGVGDTVVMDVKDGKVVPLVFRTNDAAGLPVLGWTAYKNTSLATALMPVNPGPVKYLDHAADEYKNAVRRIEASRPVGTTLHPIAFWTWMAVLLCGLALVVALWMRKERAVGYLSILGAALVAYVPATNLILAAKNASSGLFGTPLTAVLAPAFLDLAALAAATVLLRSRQRSF